MFISDFAIKRPIITIVSMIALVVFGLVALWRLDTDEFPDINAPIVFVGVEGAGGPLGGLGRAVGAQLRSPFVRGRMRMLASRDGGPSLDVVLAEAAAGRLRTMEDRVVGLAGVAEAIDALVAGRVCGKVLVEIDR